jgi:hypothetical protein
MADELVAVQYIRHLSLARAGLAFDAGLGV